MFQQRALLPLHLQSFDFRSSTHNNDTNIKISPTHTYYSTLPRPLIGPLFMETTIRLLVTTFTLLYFAQECNCADKMHVVRSSTIRRAAFLATPSFREKARKPCSRNSRRIVSTPGIPVFELNNNPYREKVVQKHGRWMSTNSLTPDTKETASEEEIYNELQRLTTLIQDHDNLYYTPGLSPNVSDDEFDALTEREAELCRRYPTLLKRLEQIKLE